MQQTIQELTRALLQAVGASGNRGAGVCTGISAT
ncbi:hypothetical protein Taro_031685 [Colocasia esculenta]|uniref:Uncharacterized protein n=1 Tax=Colocasia esculenta TaxID=4460 RepID=A0A843W3V9_COLES|nr:hypothetical protein [Colocasia esculenta]